MEHQGSNESPPTSSPPTWTQPLSSDDVAALSATMGDNGVTGGTSVDWNPPASRRSSAASSASSHESGRARRRRSSGGGSAASSVSSGYRTTERGMSRRMSSRRLTKRERKRALAEAALAQQKLTRQFASLQLPHMPNNTTEAPNSSSEQAYANHQTGGEPPTVRILVVADIDLPSASALAESALGQTDDKENPLQRVDLCIACGPFCREEDLRNYYQGRQRRRHMARYSGATMPMPINPANTNPSSGMYAHGTATHTTFSPGGPRTGRRHSTGGIPPTPSSYPYKRTREETAALEGLMTAALSQLESIVCRVVFVPGKMDPITSITSSSTSVAYTKERRLTPNSRNIHQHWMPLTPGLGCAGLLYLDGQRLQQQPPPLEDDEDEEEDEDIDSETSSLAPEDSSSSYPQEEDQSAHSPTAAQIPEATQSFDERTKDYGNEFCQHLEQLVGMAPPLSAVSATPNNQAQITELLHTQLFQTILVSHFHHLEQDESETKSRQEETWDHASYMSPAATMQHQKQQEMESSQSGTSEDDEIEDDEEEESFDPPWPQEHEAFCAQPMVQEHVLLEIAAGRNSKGMTVRPMELPKGPTMRVILPGSLRERGEFCLVDVSFMKSPHSTGDYRWRVRRTRFQTISDYV